MILYEELISLPRLLQAWEAFRKEKTNKRDVQSFSLHLEDNLFALHTELKRQTYRHNNYEAFWMHDPKRRHIHKACVTDRVLHHLLYTYLYELFDPIFIHDSYSCRLGKGTHKGVERLVSFVRKVSTNYTKNCWTLQFDIKQFFASSHSGWPAVSETRPRTSLIILLSQLSRVSPLLGSTFNTFHPCLPSI